MQTLTNKILDAGLMKLKELEAQKTEIEKSIDLLEQEIQDICQHPDDQIVEGEFIEGFGNHPCTAPFRVCMICGRAEYQWGMHGSLKRPRHVSTIAREKAHQYVRGKVLTQEALGRAERERKTRTEATAQ
jgi:hypothetical protein